MPAGRDEVPAKADRVSAFCDTMPAETDSLFDHSGADVLPDS